LLHCICRQGTWQTTAQGAVCPQLAKADSATPVPCRGVALTDGRIARRPVFPMSHRWNVGQPVASPLDSFYRRRAVRERAGGFDSLSDSAQVPLAAIHTRQVAIALAGGVAVQTHLTKQSSMARSPDFFIGLSAGGFHAQAQRKMGFVLARLDGSATRTRAIAG
jgi:hypothetical protein